MINNDYRVSAAGGHRAIGSTIAVIIDPQQVYLPLLRR